jgi:predicted TPR repeat methyltransferase
LIFTVEKADPALLTLRVREPRYAKRDEYEGFVLQPHGRYCHTEDYVRRTLTEAGLTVRELAPGILRKEMGLPVQGIVASARKRGLEPP